MSLLSTHCLGLSSISCQEAIVLWFHGCSHCVQWFWSPRRGKLSLLPPFPLLFAMQYGARCHYLSFFFFSLKPALSFSSFTLIKRLFSCALLSAIRVVSYTYWSLVIFVPLILIPACNTSSLAFSWRCSVYSLHKQGDSRQPCHTPFSILNQSVVPHRVLAVASWPAYRFFRRQVRWSGIPISLRTFHSCYDLHTQRL